jgi:hypothetical protein
MRTKTAWVTVIILLTLEDAAGGREGEGAILFENVGIPPYGRDFRKTFTA